MTTLLLALLTQAVDLDALRAKADALLEEAKTAYESARSTSSVPGFVEAGFKLEEARIKYLVLLEIGQGELQKTASDRLRAVNQLNKLINDGRVAVQKPADAPAAAPTPDAAPPPPAAPAPAVTARAPVPDAARQKAAETLVKDVFKDQYAKKAPADRQALARALLQEAERTADDPAGRWVLYREAQDVAVQIYHVPMIVAAVDATSRMFDVDGLALKNAALAAAGKTAKTPADGAALADAHLRLIDELMAADQYDAADKAAAAAQQHAKRGSDAAQQKRTAARAKEVAEAKSKFQAQKKVMETLAKNPDDPGANNEFGQFLCYVKSNWDLGLRFLVKGSDAALRGLAEREIAGGVEAAADGWFEHAQKEKSTLRKSQTLQHARDLYERALIDATGLARVKIEKRLAEIGGAESGSDAGLAAHWRFDEKTGTTAADASGNVVLHLSDGAAWTAGRSGGALSLNGAGASGTAADSTLMNVDGGPFSVACFVRSRDTKPSRVVTKWHIAVGGGKGWVMDLHTANYAGPGVSTAKPGTLRVKMSDGANVVDVSTPAGLGTGAWRHVAFSADPKGDGLRLYVDGAPLGGATPLKALSSLNTQDALGVGWLTGQREFMFNGDIDDLRLYRRALSAAEVKELATKK